MKIEFKHFSMLEEAQRCGRPDTAALRLCFELLAVASAIDRDCAARLSPYGLSESRFVLIFLLRDRTDGLPPHELADRAGVTRATITGLLDGLERDDFLTRRSDTGDRRKLLVQLTQKGQTLAGELFHQHAEWIDCLLAGLDVQERRLLSELLTIIWRNTDTATHRGTEPIEAPA